MTGIENIPVTPEDPTIQARVPGWMVDAIGNIADSENVFLAEVIRQALKAYLHQLNIYAPSKDN